MFVVVYDDEQVFVAAFQDGKLKRVVDGEDMNKVQQTLFAAAVTLSLPTMSISTGGGGTTTTVTGGVTGDSDFGTPAVP